MGGPLIGALEFEGLETFTVKHLLNPKITFPVTNEKGSTLNRMRLRLPVVLIDLLGKLLPFQSTFIPFFNVCRCWSASIQGPCLCFYPCVTKEVNETPKV